jgi:anhydro-N-acetylmuramic acid kinase
MSGSSLDGLDICYSRIAENKEVYSYEILSSTTVNFPESLLKSLKNSRSFSSDELKQLDINFGQWIGETCVAYKQEKKIASLDFIASHGHTVFHYPEKKQTLQIGCGQTIANLSGFPVINNLREKDVLAGGQGAPIVPIGDLLLFPEIKYCLNLGGIMNISFKENEKIFSGDLGVCNQVINHYAQQKGLEYDKDGHLARKGQIDLVCFERLNALPFFHKSFPKSLDNGFSKELINILDITTLTIEDKLRTFYEHVVFQISKHILDKEKLLITGGGAHNNFLMDLIKAKDLNLSYADELLIDNKEALIMSLIGVRFLENKFNVLASVTGADFNTICGDLYKPFESI